MPLNSSGPISLGGTTVGQSVELELSGVYGTSGSNTISFNDSSVRGLLNIPSGAISLFDAYGKSIGIPFGLFGGYNSGGSLSSSTSKYTYATDTVTSGTNLTYAAGYMASCGNYSIALFGGGG